MKTIYIIDKTKLSMGHPAHIHMNGLIYFDFHNCNFVSLLSCLYDVLFLVVLLFLILIKLTLVNNLRVLR